MEHDGDDRRGDLFAVGEGERPVAAARQAVAVQEAFVDAVGLGLVGGELGGEAFAVAGPGGLLAGGDGFLGYRASLLRGSAAGPSGDRARAATHHLDKGISQNGVAGP